MGDNIDYLTGLCNRKGLYERIAGFAEDEHVNFMFLDLDNFKTVNDVYGHQAGDEVLITFGQILKECAPEALAVRIGGDEFVLVFLGMKTKAELSEMAERIINKMRASQSQTQFRSMVSVSVGIVWNEQMGKSFEHILAKSDTAMYQAKQNGKSCYVFYDDIKGKILEEKEMADSVSLALEKDQFQIRYAPVINMQNSRLEQSEVYVYWTKDEHTVWVPDEYRGVLERNGFIRKLDMHIFEVLCRQLQLLKNKYDMKVKLSVQLSRLLFLEDNLPENLAEIMKQYGVEAKDFDLSIDETSLGLRYSDKLIAAMKRLRDMGFSLSLLHFGKDFSGFRYLRELPINTIKFDKTYIKENLQNNRGRQIIKTLLKLGKELKMMVAVYGISNADEVVFLSGCGCDAAGGSYYLEPCLMEDYIEYVKDKIQHGSNCISYPFLENLMTEDGRLPGKLVGEGIQFVKGVSDKWGGIYFPGGDSGKNVIHFPGNVFPSNSYTISLWIKPEEIISWGSVLYMRYLEGFASLVPYLGDGLSAFRISEDIDVNGWHDILCRAVKLHQWSFLTVTYDSFNASTRYYINGRKAGYQVNVPTMISCKQVILGGDPFQSSYKGSVSGWMLFDYVKTEEEIVELYHSFLKEPGFCGELEDYWLDIE